MLLFEILTYIEAKCNSFLANSKFYAEAKEKLPDKSFTEVVCDDWPQLIDDGELTVEMMRRKAEEFSDVYSDGVILGCTQFSDVQDDLAEVISWKQGRIVDEFALVLRNICHVLRLRGGDGRRKK